jgi:hypothetical protein
MHPTTTGFLGPDGTPIAADGWHDTESIARDGEVVCIGIERVNQVLRSDFGRDGVRAHGKLAVRLLTGDSSNGTVQRGNYRKPT